MFSAAKYLRIPVQFPYMKSTEKKKKMYIRDIKEQNFENSYIVPDVATILAFYSHLVSFLAMGYIYL